MKKNDHGLNILDLVSSCPPWIATNHFKSWMLLYRNYYVARKFWYEILHLRKDIDRSTHVQPISTINEEDDLAWPLWWIQLELLEICFLKRLSSCWDFVINLNPVLLHNQYISVEWQECTIIRWLQEQCRNFSIVYCYVILFLTKNIVMNLIYISFSVPVLFTHLKTSQYNFRTLSSWKFWKALWMTRIPSTGTWRETTREEGPGKTKGAAQFGARQKGSKGRLASLFPNRCCRTQN